MVEIDAAFVSLEEAQVSELGRCTDGLFMNGKGDAYSDALIAGSEEARFVIYLGMPKGPMSNSISPANRPRGVGLFWPKPLIEVDARTMYRVNVEGERPGDLVVAPGAVEIVALQPDGWGMTHRIPLWQQVQASAEEPVGFRSWRLVSLAGEQRRIVFTRLPPQP